MSRLPLPMAASWAAVHEVFGLLTASLGADDFRLRQDWDAGEHRLKGGYPALSGLQSDDF